MPSSEMPDFLTLLVGKLCHDLAGPIGAVRNAMEMHDDMPETRDEALQSVREQAEGAVQMLQLFRLMLGTPGASLSTDDWRHLRFGKATLTCDDVPAALPTVLARPLLLQLAADAVRMPRGGTLHVRGVSAGDETTLEITAQGTPLLPVPTPKAGIIASREVWHHAAARYAAEAGIERVVRQDDGVSVCVLKSAA